MFEEVFLNRLLGLALLLRHCLAKCTHTFRLGGTRKYTVDGHAGARNRLCALRQPCKTPREFTSFHQTRRLCSCRTLPLRFYRNRSQACSLLLVAAPGWVFREERRLGRVELVTGMGWTASAPPRGSVRCGINLALTFVVLAAAVSGKVEPAVCFIVGTVVALMVNVPNAERHHSGQGRRPEQSYEVARIRLSLPLRHRAKRGFGHPKYTR